jgi:uncharacterized lipoprotein YmbA
MKQIKEATLFKSSKVSNSGSWITCMASCAALILSAGCLGLSPEQDPTKFYTLTATAAVEEKSNESLPNIGIREVVLPGYHNRASIAYRKSEHEIAYISFHDWAEPLSQNVLRTLGENLNHHSQVGHVYLRSWTYSDVLQTAMNIHVERFDWNQENGNVQFEGSIDWNLVKPIDEKTISHAKRFSIEIPLSEGSDPVRQPDVIIQAMNTALAELSEIIVETVIANP